jgi:hypothetical protein
MIRRISWPWKKILWHFNRKPFQFPSVFDFWSAYVVYPQVRYTSIWKGLVADWCGCQVSFICVLEQEQEQHGSCDCRLMANALRWQLIMHWWLIHAYLHIRHGQGLEAYPCVETSELVQRESHSAVCDELVTLWVGTAVVWVVATTPHKQWRAICMTEYQSWVCSQGTSSRYPEIKHNLWPKFLHGLLQRYIACSTAMCVCTKMVHSGVAENSDSPNPDQPQGPHIKSEVRWCYKCINFWYQKHCIEFGISGCTETLS